jgi:hypothetical protein
VIRSGDHALWDAHPVRGRARADIAALAAAFAPAAEAFRRLGVSVARSLEQMRPAFEQFSRSLAEVERRRLAGAQAAGAMLARHLAGPERPREAPRRIKP